MGVIDRPAQQPADFDVAVIIRTRSCSIIPAKNFRSPALTNDADFRYYI
jgi:hypothetical protein